MRLKLDENLSRRVAELFRQAGFFKAPVPAGQDGRCWYFTRCIGQRLLMTVPAYLARTSAELLLPAEVVEADEKGR